MIFSCQDNEVEVCDFNKYFSKDSILFLTSDNKNDVMHEIINSLYDKEILIDRDAFLNAILEREQIASTGIGNNIAVPHAKLTSYNDFFVSIGVHKKGVNWSSIDGAPVRIVFMIGGPHNRQMEYLKLLSAITSILKSDARKDILMSQSASEVMEVISNAFKAFIIK